MIHKLTYTVSRTCIPSSNQQNLELTAEKLAHIGLKAHLAGEEVSRRRCTHSGCNTNKAKPEFRV
jgi:hypothetical protein